MTEIARLQDEYIKTSDSKVLADFYVQVLKLAKFICGYNKLPNSLDDAYELAALCTERLMTKKEPVFKSSPSSYLTTALYYMNKPKREVALEDWITYHLDPSDSEYQDYVDQLLERFYIPEDIYTLVVDTLRNKQDYKTVKDSINDERLRKLYQITMETIRKNVKSKAM